MPRRNVAVLLATVAILATLLAVVPAGSQAQESALGRTSFPNSGPASAQQAFLNGVLLLHSFEYDRAAEAFRAAQAEAPGFALAYWGEAMTHNHPIWFRQDQAAARTILRRLGETPEARLARAPTDREKHYLRAVEILFGDGPKARRDTLYAEAMGQMRERWPDDENATAFYALAILGTSHGGRDIPTYMRAAAVAEEVYERNPDHPGALHYLIHAYDDPVHAPLGLRAARRYSVIAGDAPHAQHMTTHIFVAMGMWDDVVSQNEIASGPDPAAWLPGHYTWWLGYGYLQQGRHRDAEAHVEAMRRHLAGSTHPHQVAHLLRMRAEYVANTGQWDHPSLRWEIDRPANPSSFAAALMAADDYLLGRAALARGDLATAARAAADLAASARSAEATRDPNDPTPGVARVMELQLRGLIARAETGHSPGDETGDEDRLQAGIEILEQALALEQSLPFEFGPPLVVVPSGELLGEILLAENRPADAVAAFQATLAVAPGRALSLLGLARAARLTGDEQTAQRSFARLLENWHSADPDLPTLAEVRQAVE